MSADVRVVTAQRLDVSDVTFDYRVRKEKLFICAAVSSTNLPQADDSFTLFMQSPK